MLQQFNSQALWFQTTRLLEKLYNIYQIRQMGAQCSRCYKDNHVARSILKVPQEQASYPQKDSDNEITPSSHLMSSNIGLDANMENESGFESSSDKEKEQQQSSWSGSSKKYKLSDQTNISFQIGDNSSFGAHRSNVILTTSDVDIEPFSPDIVHYQNQLQQHEVTLIKMKQKMINEKQRAAIETEKKLNGIIQNEDKEERSEKSKKELRADLKRYKKQIRQEKQNIHKIKKGTY